MTHSCNGRWIRGNQLGNCFVKQFAILRMHCYICNVMNRILQLFSCFLLTLHLGIPVVLQADHGHFLGKYWNAEEQLESDACCPSESHKPLDRTDNCPLCQRALTSFVTLSVC